MSLVYKDRVRQKLVPSGTGSVDLDIPVDSYVTFSNASLSSNSFPYVIISDNLFEVGIGTFMSPSSSGTTYGRLYRNTVLSNSSLDTSLISFTGVTGDVLITNAAELSVLVNVTPTSNTRRIIKWVDGEYQLIESVENATTLGASIGSSILFYNHTTTNYNADSSLKFYPGDLPELYVNGVILATAKSFKISHPNENKKFLYHGCLEGPEHGIYLRGDILTKFRKRIDYPDYFNSLKECETIHITSSTVVPYNIQKYETGFEIKLLLPVFKEIKFTYLVIAQRKDVKFILEE